MKKHAVTRFARTAVRVAAGPLAPYGGATRDDGEGDERGGRRGRAAQPRPTAAETALVSQLSSWRSRTARKSMLASVLMSSPQCQARGPCVGGRG